MSFIDQHRAAPGVEPICKRADRPVDVLRAQGQGRGPGTRTGPGEAGPGAVSGGLSAVWDENYQVYGARKVWHQLKREGQKVARCTVERLMRQLEIQGVRRGGKRWTTLRDATLPQPADRVNRHFAATRPNRLWVA